MLFTLPAIQKQHFAIILLPSQFNYICWCTGSDGLIGSTLGPGFVTIEQAFRNLGRSMV